MAQGLLFPAQVVRAMFAIGSVLFGILGITLILHEGFQETLI